MAAPESLRVPANELTHHVLEWSPAAPGSSSLASGSLVGAGPKAATRTVVLVHGYMDAAGTWDRVAPHLASRGLRVLAPDMRGYGEGARVPTGGYYHFSDYVFDLADLVDALSPGEPVALVGHSMGGTITTLYSGAYPERVARLANLEGLGPPDHPFEIGPVRMRRWIDDVRGVRARAGRVVSFTREEALARLAANHPNVPAAVLENRLPHLVKEQGEGRLTWRFDPLHRTTSPVPFFTKLYVEFAKKVTCPVLFVDGGPTGFHPPDEEERLAAFSMLTRETIEGAGHMMHWTKPDEVARAVLRFLGE